MDEKKIKLLLREFAKKRDWEKFHNLKNLACALFDKICRYCKYRFGVSVFTKNKEK